ncbi:MAG: amidase [Pseudomonadota bacterium]|nr:amidase [Pseudomonadota bacterium]
MDNPARASATELVAAIRRREIGSEELLDIYLERYRRLNGPINAVVATDLEAARARARAADTATARGESWGPLHGLPMTVKEAFEVVGMPCTSGSPTLLDHRPARHATAVERLVEAGAVIWGKTNIPLWTGDFQSFNQVYGTTNNPWDLARGPGGSSGGSAAALAAGLTPLELGSDIGGSIRNPAHFCGVAGLKPSFGIVPIRGHIPGPPGHLTSPDIGVAGPMARTVDDLELELGVIAGADAYDAPGWKLDLAPPRHRRLGDYRVAVWAEDPFCHVDPGVQALIEQAAEALADGGATVLHGARPDFTLREAHEVFYMLLAAEMGAPLPEAMRRRMRENPPAADASDHPSIFARGAVMDHAAWLDWNERRMGMRDAWRRFFGEVDVLLCPVMPRAAFPHDQAANFQSRRVMIDGQSRDYVDMIVWCGLVGGSWLPSAVVPVGLTTEGLPVGVQVVANFLEDRTALDVARHIERALGGLVPPGYE